MSLLANAKNSRELKPPRILIHGPEKIGKTSFAAECPDIIFMATEDGQEAVDVMKIDVKDYASAFQMISELYTEAHDYRAVAIDSADWLEDLLFQQVAAEANKKDISDIGYGAGYATASTMMREFLRGLTALRDERGMAVIMIAHSAIIRFDDPLHESYDKYTLKMHKQISPLLVEWADMILFAQQETMVMQKEKRFDKKVNRAVGSNRVLFTAPSPSYIAGNRYNLPDKIPLSWNAFIDAYSNSQKTPTQEGETTNG